MGPALWRMCFHLQLTFGRKSDANESNFRPERCTYGAGHRVAWDMGYGAWGMGLVALGLGSGA